MWLHRSILGSHLALRLKPSRFKLAGGSQTGWERGVLAGNAFDSIKTIGAHWNARGFGQGLVNPLFAAAASRVQAQDQDQEVKEAAMMAACKAIAVLGDALGPAVPPFLQVPYHPLYTCIL